jgi:hypothetical protein
MLSLRNVLALTATLFLLTATAGYSGHNPESTRNQDNSSPAAAVAHQQHAGVAHTAHTTHTTHAATHVAAHPKHVHTVSHPAEHDDLDAVALTDIHRYASHHFTGASELPHSFRAEHDWAQDWELHWIDYHVHGGVVRLYHAVHKHNPELRFTSLLHHTDGHYQGWRQVE